MNTENLPDSSSSQSQKFFKIFLLLFVLCLPLLFISEFINQRIFFFQRATGGNPSFSFNPSSLTVNPGREFLVEIKINTGNKQTSGASAQIAFNNQVFEVQEIIPGKDIPQAPRMFSTILRNKIDNQNGKAYLDAGVEVANPQYYVGEGIFGKIKFKVKDQAVGGNKTISFFLTNPANPKLLGDCDILGANEKAGQDLLGEINNLSVSIGSTLSPTSTPESTITPRGSTPTQTPIPTPTLTRPLTSSHTPSPISSPKPTLLPNSPDLAADISGKNGQPDNKVDIYDFNAIMSHWNKTQNISQYDISGPQNQPDGKIDFYDLTKVLVFFESP